MANISEVRHTKVKEAQSNRNRLELKRLQEQHEDKYSATSKKLEKEQKQLKKDYEVQFDQEQVKLELQLAKMRKTHKQVLGEERVRLDQELENLKKSVTSQKIEVMSAHEEEILRMNEDHEEQLNTMRRKFQDAQKKYQV